MSDTPDTTRDTEHYPDPDRPGWCAVCRCAYPCPATATGDEIQRLLSRYDER